MYSMSKCQILLLYLKNSLNGDLLNYIASKKEKTSMTSGDLDLWDMVTKKNLYNPGRVLDICAKNEVDPTIGLGGVRPQTDRQTHRQRTYGYYSIDHNPICVRIYNQNYSLDVLFKCWFYLRIFASIMNNHNDWNWISNVYLGSFIEFFTFFGEKEVLWPIKLWPTGR